MANKKNLSRSMICTILIFLISTPIYPERKGIHVTVELLNNNSNQGELLKVTEDSILVNENGKAEQLPFQEIHKIVFTKRSTTLNRVVFGSTVGCMLGSIIGATVEIEPEGFLLARSRKGRVIQTTIFYGTIGGILASIVLKKPKQKQYIFSQFSEKKKKRFINKLRTKARVKK